MSRSAFCFFLDLAVVWPLCHAGDWQWLVVISSGRQESNRKLKLAVSWRLKLKAMVPGRHCGFSLHRQVKAEVVLSYWLSTFTTTVVVIILAGSEKVSSWTDSAFLIQTSQDSATCNQPPSSLILKFYMAKLFFWKWFKIGKGNSLWKEMMPLEAKLRLKKVVVILFCFVVIFVWHPKS